MPRPNFARPGHPPRFSVVNLQVLFCQCCTSYDHQSDFLRNIGSAQAQISIFKLDAIRSVVARCYSSPEPIGLGSRICSQNLEVPFQYPYLLQTKLFQHRSHLLALAAERDRVGLPFSEGQILWSYFFEPFTFPSSTHVIRQSSRYSLTYARCSRCSLRAVSGVSTLSSTTSIPVKM